MTLLRFAQSLGGRSLASLSCWEPLLRFAQLLGDAPSLCSVTGGMLPRFAQSLGGRSLALLSCWGDTPLLRSVAGRRPSLRSVAGDAPSLRSVAGGCSLTSLSRWGDSPSFCSVAFHSMVLSNCSKICILEGQQSNIFTFGTHCGYLHKVKMANGVINMHSRGSTLL